MKLLHRALLKPLARPRRGIHRSDEPLRPRVRSRQEPSLYALGSTHIPPNRSPIAIPPASLGAVVGNAGSVCIGATDGRIEVFGHRIIPFQPQPDHNECWSPTNQFFPP